MSDSFREDKNTLLQAALENSPELLIYGVVGANGASGGRSAKEKYWSLHLELIAWRLAGAPVEHSTLKISSKVDDQQLKDLQAAIPSHSLIAFRGKLCKNSPWGDARAKLIALLPPPEDADLGAVLAEYLKPVEFEDCLLGKLVLNRSVGWFEGEIDWMGKPIGLSLSVEDDTLPEELLNTAKALCREMSVWSEKINAYALKALLALKNDHWLEEDEEKVSEAAFLERMSLTSITIYPDGGFDFWHDDGDLFWGHSIVVSGSLEEGPTDADIPG